MQVLFFFLLLIIIRSGRLVEIRWSVCISKSALADGLSMKFEWQISSQYSGRSQQCYCLMSSHYYYLRAFLTSVPWSPTETIEKRSILFLVFELTVASRQRMTVKKEYGSLERPDVYTWWPHSGRLTREGRSQTIGWDPKTEVGTTSRQRK